jgi:hypothetical protein
MPGLRALQRGELRPELGEVQTTYRSLGRLAIALRRRSHELEHVQG